MIFKSLTGWKGLTGRTGVYAVIGAMMAALLTVCTASAQTDVEAFDSSVTSAEPMARATQSLVLDIAATSDGYIAVGERGHVLRSTNGSTWEQVADIPTRSTLTAVTSRGNRVWVAGHDQVILFSDDGGATWVRQHTSPDISDPQSNSPLLAIHFLNDSDGIAVGAYAAFIRTSDGGQSWESSSLILAKDAGDDDDDEDDGGYDDGFDDFVDFHLNGIAQLSDGTLYIAAERGNAFRSADNGETWTALTLPYGGSMFGALTMAGDQLLTFGLRGNIFTSDDQGDTWQQINSGSLNSLNGATNTASGAVVMVGVNGEVLVMREGAVKSNKLADGNDIAGIVSGADGLILVGEGGTWKYSLDDILNDQ